MDIKTFDSLFNSKPQFVKFEDPMYKGYDELIYSEEFIHYLNKKTLYEKIGVILFLMDLTPYGYSESGEIFDRIRKIMKKTGIKTKLLRKFIRDPFEHI
jgi:hypothetical protein